MNIWLFKKIQEKMDIQLESTSDLSNLLTDLEASGVVSTAERELIVSS